MPSFKMKLLPTVGYESLFRCPQCGYEEEVFWNDQSTSANLPKCQKCPGNTTPGFDQVTMIRVNTEDSNIKE